MHKTSHHTGRVHAESDEGEASKNESMFYIWKFCFFLYALSAIFDLIILNGPTCTVKNQADMKCTDSSYTGLIAASNSFGSIGLIVGFMLWVYLLFDEPTKSRTIKYGAIGFGIIVLDSAVFAAVHGASNAKQGTRSF